MSLSKQYMVFDISEDNLQAGIPVGYYADFSYDPYFREISSNAATYHLTSPIQASKFSYSTDGTTWIDFTSDDKGIIFNDTYQIKLEVNAIDAGYILINNGYTLNKVRSDFGEVIVNANINSIVYDMDIDNKTRDCYLLVNDGIIIANYDDSNSLKKRKLPLLTSSVLGISVDSGRKSFWQINYDSIYLRNFYGKKIMSLDISDIDIDISSSSSCSSNSSMSSQSSPSSPSSQSSISSQSSPSSQSSISSQSPSSSSSSASDSLGLYDIYPFNELAGPNWYNANNPSDYVSPVNTAFSTMSVTGKIGKAIASRSQYVDNTTYYYASGPVNWTPAPQFAISFWINNLNTSTGSGADSHRGILSFGNVEVSTQTIIRTGYGSFTGHHQLIFENMGGISVITTNYVLTFGSWNFVVFNFNGVGNPVQVYVDNVLQPLTYTGSLNIPTSTFTPSSTTLNVGAWKTADPPKDILDGYIDILTFYNRALTGYQVKRLWNGGAGSETGM